MNAKVLADRYAKDGFVSPIRFLTATEAADHRRSLESAEARLGDLHYLDKVHTVLRSPYELATHPRILDVAEALIGPDVLLYNAVYIVKEPQSAANVAWHQDLTYWGLADDDAQVSMWLALAPATQRSGCMQMIPGSHLHGPVEHAMDTTDDNVLLLGQRIDDLDTAGATFCPLAPGEASFHHGWTIHSSPPNRSDDRRIGLNVQYVAPHNRVETTDDASAMLVRGVDVHRNFDDDAAPSLDLDPDAVRRWTEVRARMAANFTKGHG